MDKYLISSNKNTDNYKTVFDKESSSVANSGLKRNHDSEFKLNNYFEQKEDNDMRDFEQNASFKNALKKQCINSFSQPNLSTVPFTFKFISGENLKLKYAKIFSKQVSDYIFQRLEKEVEYFSGDLVKVNVFGKWHNIPRKQVSYGDHGLSYTFSGTSIPAVPWEKCQIIKELKQIVESVTGYCFNYVLVNRYKDGMDHMGKHRDHEKDLVYAAPIASLSIGQPRDFIFKHKDIETAKATRKIDPVKIELEHGSLLLMEWPTNHYWYHSLPVRKKAVNVRINLTFREMVNKA